MRSQYETVLVVEDDELVRRLTSLVLGKAGYHVLLSGDGKLAMQLAAEYAGRIHLLLADVVIPGISGCRVAEELTRLRPGLQVLYMSGYSGDALARSGTSLTDANLLRKPFTPRMLLDEVRQRLGPANSRNRIYPADQLRPKSPLDVAGNGLWRTAPSGPTRHPKAADFHLGH